MTTKEEILALAGECGIQNDYISEDQAVEAFYYAARKDLEQEVERLRKDRGIEHDTANAHIFEAAELRQQLAAAQAREQQYREALQWYANENHITKLHGRESQPESRGKLEDAGFIQVTVGWTDVFVETGGKANEALVQPTDTTALEAMIAEAKSDQSNFDNQLFMRKRARLITQAGEVMRERSATVCDKRSTYYGRASAESQEAKDCAFNIRALPGVKLEDLK